MTARGPLWETPRRVRLYVFGVEFVAVLGVALSAVLVPVEGTAWFPFAVLAACVVLHIELVRGVELQRDLHLGGRRIHVDTQAVWSFAATLALPPVLASAVVLLAFCLTWTRLKAPNPDHLLYRSVFSCATVLCATQAAALVLHLGMRNYPGIPVGDFPATLADLGVVALAGFVRWAVNYGLVSGAVAVSTRDATPATVFRHIKDQLLEIGTIGLAVVTAVTLENVPLALLGVLAAVVGFHQVLMTYQYQHAARVDAKTGLASLRWWRETVDRVLRRADAGESSVASGVLLLDLDHFKAINDEHGHIAGDRVLRAVADVLESETRPRDMCCRWGGEEFAVLLFEVGDMTGLRMTAERIRARVEGLAVPARLDAGTAGAPGTGQVINGISVSVGGALHTRHATVDDLVVAADAALYQAKRQGRNRTVLG